MGDVRRKPARPVKVDKRKARVTAEDVLAQLNSLTASEQQRLIEILLFHAKDDNCAFGKLLLRELCTPAERMDLMLAQHDLAMAQPKLKRLEKMRKPKSPSVARRREFIWQKRNQERLTFGEIAKLLDSHPEFRKPDGKKWGYHAVKMDFARANLKRGKVRAVSPRR